ncbi:MAG: ArsA family ATPase [Ilumatobacteraceae bacterium]
MSRERGDTAPTTAPSTVGGVLETSQLVLVCGSGGVGKTTVSAAMGLDAARRTPRRVLVITVDPARRLADALGLRVASFAGADAVRVAPPNGDEWAGELWVAMLDTKAGWDELIRRHAPDQALAARVLANPLYHNITSRFVNSHDYLAMEQLHHLDTQRVYDLVIVDTPPSRNALDLIDAPRRMREFFASSLLKWLTVPARSRVLTAAARPFNAVAERVLGTGFLQDIIDFFVLLRTMEPGFVSRAVEVEQLLVADRTSFVVVATCEQGPVDEARYFVDELVRRRLPMRAVVLNRVLPAAFSDEGPLAAAAAVRSLAADPDAVDAWLHDEAGIAVPVASSLGDLDSAAVAHVLGEVGRRFGEVRARALADGVRRDSLERHLGSLGSAGGRGAVVVGAVPALADDVRDLAMLARLGASLSASDGDPAGNGNVTHS